MAMAFAPEAPRVRRFTSDEVWRMLWAGVLGEDEPYELINGELRYVSPQNPPHAGAIRFLNAALVRSYGDDYQVGVQLPIGGIADSIPEPDLAVTANRDVNAPHPAASETVLIIEVADSGMRTARDKVAIYAAAGCPEYWIVDIPGQRVIVHRGPGADGVWAEVREAGRDATLELPAAGRSIAVETFMPRPSSREPGEPG